LLCRWLRGLLYQLFLAPQQLLLQRGIPATAAALIDEYSTPFEYSVLAAHFQCAGVFFATLSGGGLWLTDAEQAVAVQAGKALLKSYGFLVRHAAQGGHAWFKVRPKTHTLHHLILDLNRRPTWNPWNDACWMDEDLIGRVCSTIVRKCSPVTVHVQAIRRYLALLKFKL